MWQKEQVIKELRRRGKKITAQRSLLIDVILAGDCQSCKEIYYEAVQKDQSIGLATVYRMVHMMEEIGVSQAGQCKNCMQGVSFVRRGEVIDQGHEDIYNEINQILQKNGYIDQQDFTVTIVID